MHDDDDALPALPWQTDEKPTKRRHDGRMHDGEGPQAGVAETLKTGPTSETGPQRQATLKMGLEPQTITGKVPSRH